MWQWFCHIVLLPNFIEYAHFAIYLKKIRRNAGEDYTSASNFSFFSSFQSNLLSDGLRNQVGWGHAWNRFAGPWSCHNQPNQCALTPLLPPGWWDGKLQSPITRDIRRMEAYGVRLTDLGTVDEKHLLSFCQSRKDIVKTIPITRACSGLTCTWFSGLCFRSLVYFIMLYLCFYTNLGCIWFVRLNAMESIFNIVTSFSCKGASFLVCIKMWKQYKVNVVIFIYNVNKKYANQTQIYLIQCLASKGKGFVFFYLLGEIVGGNQIRRA